MKLHSALPLFALLFGLTSCMQSKTTNIHANSAVPNDTLSYKYQNIKQRAGNCGSQADSGCTVVTFYYPVFEGQQALNDTINSRLANLFSYAKDKKEANIKEAAMDYIKVYGTAAQQGTSSHYYLKSTARVVRQDSVLMSLELTGNKLEGTTEAQKTTFINWNIPKHKNLTLDDIIVNGALPKLNQIADTIFRKEENLSLTASLANDYFFKNATFSLNTNFLITPIGIRFVFNPAEIKPLAAGQTSITIPYTKISKLLQPNTPAAIYSK